MLCHVILYHIILCYIMLYYIILYHITLYYIALNRYRYDNSLTLLCPSISIVCLFLFLFHIIFIYPPYLLNLFHFLVLFTHHYHHHYHHHHHHHHRKRHHHYHHHHHHYHHHYHHHHRQDYPLNLIFSLVPMNLYNHSTILIHFIPLTPSV